MEHFQEWLAGRRRVRQPAIEHREPAIERPEAGS
jgi:hypothetical protein